MVWPLHNFHTLTRRVCRSKQLFARKSCSSDEKCSSPPCLLRFFVFMLIVFSSCCIKILFYVSSSSCRWTFCLIDLSRSLYQLIMSQWPHLLIFLWASTFCIESQRETLEIIVALYLAVQNALHEWILCTHSATDNLLSHGWFYVYDTETVAKTRRIINILVTKQKSCCLFTWMSRPLFPDYLINYQVILML